MSRILVAVSSPWASERIAEPLAGLAKRLGAEVLVVHVSRPSGGQMREQEQADGEAAISLLRQKLEEKGVNVMANQRLLVVILLLFLGRPDCTLGERGVFLPESAAAETTEAEPPAPPEMFSTPSVGYIFDPDTRALRPILGTAGAALFGSRVELGMAVRRAWVPPRPSFLLAEVEGSQEVLLLDTQHGSEAAKSLTGLPIGANQVAVSPTGAAMAFYFRADDRFHRQGGPAHGFGRRGGHSPVEPDLRRRDADEPQAERPRSRLRSLGYEYESAGTVGFVRRAHRLDRPAAPHLGCRRAQAHQVRGVTRTGPHRTPDSLRGAGRRPGCTRLSPNRMIDT